MRKRTLFYLCWSAAVAIFMPALSAVDESSDRPVLAWQHFSQSGQSYAGLPYVFLGDSPVQLTLTIPPAQHHVLELLWGAKNATRTADLIVNGQTISLKHGGYDGFQWLRVALPDGVRGHRYDLLLRPSTQGKAAFLAEVRLAGPRTPNAPKLKANSSNAVFKLADAPNSEAFPEMRKLWDREPTTPKNATADSRREPLFGQAERNGRHAAEAFYRCRRFVDGWLANSDPKSGLIPRNLGRDRDLWNGRDAAADNYPFMVLTCALTDRPMFEGRMLDMLRAEVRLTSRLDRLGDHFLFSRQGFAHEKPDVDRIIFDNSEYVKDGLIPLTEWLGPSPWSERMAGLIDDVWKHAPIDTPFGKIPTSNIEVNGDLLQACSRLFWFTGDRKYLDWAIRLGDYFLLGTNHPTRHLKQLRLLDHGCEVVNGLSELYVAVHHAAPEKKRAYAQPLHEIFERILQLARNEHGLLYSSINPQSGEHSKGLCDTWGYVFDGFYTLHLIDKTPAYRDAVRDALQNLRGRYVGAPWDDRSADGYADSIEGAINLYNREPVPSSADWIDSQMRLMWAIQKPDGVIEGWHGDGNIARTSIMYALWKTQGTHIQPWRPDVRVGAARDGEHLLICLAADKPWSGKLIFDRPRHKEFMHLPIDYPRINQFPEWFTLGAETKCTVKNLSASSIEEFSAKEQGIPVNLRPGEEVRLEIAVKK